MVSIKKNVDNDEKSFAIVEKVNNGMYTAFNPKLQSFIMGSGKTVEEAQKDFENSVKEIREVYTNNNEKLPKELQEVVFEYRYNIASFFDYYDWINVSKLAKKIKVNDSLMRRYRGGEYISKKQVQKIENALHDLGREILGVKLTV